LSWDERITQATSDTNPRPIPCAIREPPETTPVFSPTRDAGGLIHLKAVHYRCLDAMFGGQTSPNSKLGHGKSRYRSRLGRIDFNTVVGTDFHCFGSGRDINQS